MKNGLEFEIILGSIVDPITRSKVVEEVGLEKEDFETASDRYIYESVVKRAGTSLLAYDVAEKVIFDDASIPNEYKELVGERLVQIFRTIKKRQNEQEDFVARDLIVNSAKELRQRKRLKGILSQVNDRVVSGHKAGEIFDFLEQDIYKNKSAFLSGPEFVVFDIHNEFKDRVSRREEEDRTGKRYVFADKVMQNKFPLGIRQGEMFGICADTGVGKSLSTDNIAVHASVDVGLNVLVIKTENEEIQSSSRFDSIFSGIDYQRVYTGLLSPEEINDIDLKYKSVAKKSGGRLFLVQVIPNQFDANTIRRVIDTIQNDHELVIDMLIVDSPEHQRPIEKQEQYFLQKAKPYWDLKELMKERNLILFTTIQRKLDSQNLFKKRKGKSDDDDDDDTFSMPTAEQAAGSVEIPRILDYMIMIMKQTERDKVMGIFKVAIVKSRNTERDDKYFVMQRDGRNLRQTFSEENVIKLSKDASTPNGYNNITI